MAKSEKEREVNKEGGLWLRVRKREVRENKETKVNCGLE